jgi:hypothetical protein
MFLRDGATRKMTRRPEPVLIALMMTFTVCARAAPSEQERLPPEAQLGNYVGSDVMDAEFKELAQEAQTHTVYHSLPYPSAILVDTADAAKHTN